MTASDQATAPNGEAVERVARALFDHEWKGQPGLNGEWRESRVYWVDAAKVALAAMPVDVDKRYNELLYAVSKKHHGETRHETALRYIMQSEESGKMNAGDAALSVKAPATPKVEL